MSTLFILPGVIAERSKGVIFLCQEMALLRQFIGGAWILRDIISGISTLGDGCEAGVSFRCAQTGLNIPTQPLEAFFAKLHGFSRNALAWHHRFWHGHMIVVH